MIRNRKAFHEFTPAGFDGVFEWDFILPAFEGTKITPMDFDAVIERNGMFLIFETKHIGAPVPLGQQITLEQIIRLGRGKVHVFVLQGKSAPSVARIEEWYWGDGNVKKRITQDCDYLYVLDRVKAWFQYSNDIEKQ